jgi:hypothetical protein
VNAAATVSQKQLVEFLLNVAVVRPVFVWGPPGIGKSSLVQELRRAGGHAVRVAAGQPARARGHPRRAADRRRLQPLLPARSIAAREPYCLFLDELNACSHEVQKSFYSLIHERRVGEYELPPGSIVIGAGNRAQDSAIVRPMSSALLNRMVHVHLAVSHRDWLEWAAASNVHPWVLDYVRTRPDHLWTQPPKHEEPFSTPRAWHMLSDALHEYGERLTDPLLEVLAFGCLSPHHAGQFKAFVKNLRSRYQLASILRGEAPWPHEPADRDVLYFLSQSFRAHLIKELPAEKAAMTERHKQLAHRAKALLTDLAAISLEMAQTVVSKQAEDGAASLPAWFLVEVVRDLPRLAARRDKDAP